MARLNEELARSVATKASHQESGDEDGLGSPEPLEQSGHNKRKSRTSGTTLLDQGDDRQNSSDFSQKPSRKKKNAAQDLLRQSKPRISRTPASRRPPQRQPVAMPQGNNDQLARFQQKQRRTMASSGEELAMEGYYKGFVGEWSLKQAMEETCEQAVEKSKKKFAEETERHHKALAEHDQAVSEYRVAELEAQDKRIASLEAELREVKAKLSDLEANREAS